MTADTRNKARFKALLDEIFTSFEASNASAALPGFIGEAYGEPLEHTTRRYIIDEMLIGLGWELGRLSREIVEEARLRGSTMLRMDYAGVNPGTLRARLIVEAKAWDRPFVSASDSVRRQRRTPTGPDVLLARAIEHYKRTLTLNGSPVIGEWAESIQQLHEYVTAVFAQSGYRVARVAITAGKWLVIFTDPHAAFADAGAVDPLTIRIFEGRAIVEHSDDIYDFLSQGSLVEDPPDIIEPTEITNHASLAEVVRLFRALWIARRKDGAHFSPYPQINVYPALVIERSDQKLVTVVDKQSRRLIPHQTEVLHDHLSELSIDSDRLLASINQQLGGVLTAAPLSTFPGFLSPNALGVGNAVSVLKAFVKSWRRGPNEFVVVTGEATHYFRNAPNVNPCAGHSWASCRDLGQHHPGSAIIDRTFEPAAFFTTNEPHHCAHREIHHRRNNRCQISPFEEFLCCRACVFEQTCWSSAELGQLPCGARVPNQQASVPPAEQQPTPTV